MKIKFAIDGKERTFTAPFVPTRVLRETLELCEAVNFEHINLESLDKLSGYLVRVFGGQFAEEQLLDGYPADSFIGMAAGVVNAILKGVAEKAGEIDGPNAYLAAKE